MIHLQAADDGLSLRLKSVFFVGGIHDPVAQFSGGKDDLFSKCKFYRVPHQTGSFFHDTPCPDKIKQKIFLAS